MSYDDYKKLTPEQRKIFRDAFPDWWADFEFLLQEEKQLQEERKKLRLKGKDNKKNHNKKDDS